MMKRQILIFTGFLVLCLSLSFISSALAEQYQVKKGDSLYSISREFGVKISAIQQENSLGGTKLKAGQILNISGNGSAAPAIKAKTKSVTQTGHLSYYIVKKGDTLSLIARKTGVPAKEIAALNNIKPRNLRIGRKLMLAPPPPIKSPAIEETLSDDEADEEMMQSLAPADPAEDNKRNPELLGKWESPDERKLLVKVATGFLGAPYKLGGSTVRGIDCSAFVRKMYAFFGITLPRTAREQANVGLCIERQELVEGDLVFFRTRKPVGHVGIYIGNNEFVHASSRDRVVKIDSLETPYFYKRFVRAVRLKSLEDSGV